MGRLLDQYIQENMTELETIVLGSPQRGGPGMRQPGGTGETFPVPQQAPISRGYPIDAAGKPTAAFPMEATPAPDVAPGPGQTPTPAFDAPTQPQPQAQPNMDRGPDSFMGMAENASEKDIDNALKALEKAGVNIDEKYAEVAGSPGEGMSRREKGLVLMEFGLNLMAQSGTGEGTLGSDIGMAGMAAMRGHQGRQAGRAQAAAATEDRALERRKTEAEIARAERPDIRLETDASGNLVRINMQTGEAMPVTLDGKPVSNEGERNKFATEVDRAAYEAEFCTGLSGNEMKSCRRRALAYAKGVREVAFPETLRADQTDRVMRQLEDPDNSAMKFEVNGELKRWKAMTPDEQTQVANRLVNRRIEVINAGGVSTADKQGRPTMTAESLFSSLSSEQQSQMKPGRIYTYRDKEGNEYRVKLVDGKPVMAD